MTDLFEAGGLPDDAPRPLADRLRPKTLAEVVGQDHLMGPEGPIGRMVTANRPHSILGSGGARFSRSHRLAHSTLCTAFAAPTMAAVRPTS